MPGPGGVGGVGNQQWVVVDNNLNLGNVDINLNDVGDIGIGGVDAGNAQPQGVAHDPGGTNGLSRFAQQTEQANELSRKLDVLLTRAANISTSLVDENALATAVKKAKGSGIDKAMRTAINDAAENAATKFKTLNSFTGRQLASAVKTVTDKDGNKFFDWDDSNPVGKAIHEALDAQAELSAKLGEMLNMMKRGSAKETVEEALLQCDRRSCEMQTLLMEVTNIAENQGLDDPAVKARLDSSLSGLMAKKSVTMHGNDTALVAMKEQLAPIAKRLDDLGKNPNVQLSNQELFAINREIDLACNALALVSKTGEMNGVAVDRSLMSSAKTALDDVKKKLANVRTNIGRASMQKFVDNVFGPTPFKIANPKFLPLLKKLAPELARTVEMRQIMHETATKYVKSPSRGKADQLEFLADDYLDNTNEGKISREISKMGSPKRLKGFDDIEAGVANLVNSLDKKSRAQCTPDVIKDFCDAFRELRQETAKYADDDMSPDRPCEQMRKYFFHDSAGVHSQVEHLKIMQKSLKGMTDDKLVTSSSVRAVFEGGLKFSTLVEARMHGMTDDMVDPKLDDSRMVSSRPLGHGKVNTVYEVTYADNTKYVFKPEAAGRQSIESLSVIGNIEATDMVASLNAASQKTADALGLDDVMTKTTVGSHDGKFGIFMEKADGKELVDFQEPGKGTAESLSGDQIRFMTDDKHEIVVGRAMRQANRIEWFDLITGQGDRHAHNFMLNVDSNLNVKLKAIDNDACYPDYQSGLRVYDLGEKYSEKFKSALNDVAKLFGVDNKQDRLDLLNKDPGLTINEDGFVTVDVAKVKSPEILYCLRKATGLHTIHIPTHIDQDLYDHLMTLQNGTAERTAYLDSLRTKLSPKAFEAAVSRLDAAIEHAKKLKSENKVVATADWEKKDVQRSIVGKLRDKYDTAPLGLHNGKKPVGNAPDIAGSIFHCTAGYIKEQIIPSIVRYDWFEHEASEA